MWDNELGGENLDINLNVSLASAYTVPKPDSTVPKPPGVSRRAWLYIYYHIIEIHESGHCR